MFSKKMFQLLLVLIVHFLENNSYASDNWSDLSTSEYVEKLTSCQIKLKKLEWKYLLWPKVNEATKPKFSEVIDINHIKQQIINELKMQVLLQDEYKFAINSQMIQKDIIRMLKNSKNKNRLKEIFSVLGDDSNTIAHCISRKHLIKESFNKKYDWGNNSEKLNEQIDSIELSAFSNSFRDFEVPKLKNINGQLLNTGNNWLIVDNSNAPTPRHSHTAIWTGNDMIIWGGNDNNLFFNTGMKYNPTLDYWSFINSNSNLNPRRLHTAIWTGNEMIIWGGSNEFNVDRFGDGARYNPLLDIWTPVSNSNSPEERRYHTTVFTGDSMIIWGGINGTYLNNGSKYNIQNNTWESISQNNAPSPRVTHSATFYENEIIIWGGHNENNLNTGGRYNVQTNSWIPTTTINAPSARRLHTAVLKNNDIYIWGGRSDNGFENTGSVYNIQNDTWTSMNNINAPTPRIFHTAVSNNDSLIIWGGYAIVEGLFMPKEEVNSGSFYNYTSKVWSIVENTNSPHKRLGQTSLLINENVVIWGGSYYDSILSQTVSLNSIGIYQPFIEIIFENGFE